MELILTIALNPSVVRKLDIEDYQTGGQNEAVRDELSVGDCGIYSAYVVKVMQGEPYVMAISGGIGGRFIKNFLDRNRIKTDFINVDHETSTLMFIHDKRNDVLTEISSHHEMITKRNLVNIKHKVNNHIDETEMVMISGKDPATPRLLHELHSMSKERKKIILGVSGEVLAQCIDNFIFGVVIDQKDLAMLGLDFPETVESYEAIMRFQRERHIKYVIVRGRYEIIGFTKNKIIKLHYHSRDDIYPIVKSTILGGLTIGIKRGYPFERIMKLIGAIANASSLDQFPFIIKRKDVDRGVNQCKLDEMYNHRNGYMID